MYPRRTDRTLARLVQRKKDYRHSCHLAGGDAGHHRTTAPQRIGRLVLPPALSHGTDRHGPEGIQGTVTEEAANRTAEQLKTLQAQAAEKAKAKRESELAGQARQAEAKKKNKEKETQRAAPAPPPPNPAPATPKPAGGPVIVVKKLRTPPPTCSQASLKALPWADFINIASC
jgi:hypothetical protein